MYTVCKEVCVRRLIDLQHIRLATLAIGAILLIIIALVHSPNGWLEFLCLLPLVLVGSLLDAWYLAAAGTLGLVLSEVFSSVPWIPPPTTVFHCCGPAPRSGTEPSQQSSAKGSATPEAGRVAHILREQSGSRALACACRRSFGSWISRILWADEMAEGAGSFPQFNQ